MGTLERIGTIIRANLNDLLSRAEDPEKIINQTILDMREAQYQARMEVAAAIAEGKKLERDVGASRREASDWLAKAERAVDEGRDDLAREALRRKRTAEDLAAGLDEQLEAHRTMIERLKTQLRALDAKLDEAERKRRVLLARQKRSEARESVGRAMELGESRTSFEAFDRMEAKIAHEEDRLDATEELSEDLDLDAELDALGEDDGLAEELAALKARRGGGAGDGAEAASGPGEGSDGSADADRG